MHSTLNDQISARSVKEAIAQLLKRIEALKNWIVVKVTRTHNTATHVSSELTPKAVLTLAEHAQANKIKGVFASEAYSAEAEQLCEEHGIAYVFNKGSAYGLSPGRTF